MSTDNSQLIAKQYPHSGQEKTIKDPMEGFWYPKLPRQETKSLDACLKVFVNSLVDQQSWAKFQCTPSQMAEEYICSKPHAQSLLRLCVRKGIIQRDGDDNFVSNRDYIFEFTPIYKAIVRAYLIDTGVLVLIDE